MILSRLSRHLREQNWVAVIIEFVIVVLGVAVGFQLTERYDRAQRAMAEAEYLEGIATDYRIYQNLLLCRIDLETEIMQGLSHLISVTEGDALNEAQLESVILALNMSHISQPGLPVEGNTSALVAGDLVATISDEDLRGLILAAQSISTSTTTSMQQVQDFFLTIERFDVATRRDFDAGSGYYIASSVDVETLRAHPDIRNILIDLYNLHRSSQLNDERLLRAVTNVLTRLETIGAIAAPETEPSCESGAAASAD